VLVCSERRVLLAGCWWLIYSERKYCWLVADKPSHQSSATSHQQRVSGTFLSEHITTSHLSNEKAESLLFNHRQMHV
jgi:hypothetical protein